jgi:hypothetical protein
LAAGDEASANSLEDTVSLLARTNQQWKLYLFVAAMALGFGLTVFQSVIAGQIGKEHTTTIAVTGMALVAGGFAWAAAFITCPNCTLKLFWHALTKEGLASWFGWLLNQEECPQCGSRDGLAPPKGRKRKSL